MATSYKTIKPTGLSISRSGELFTFSWKIGDSDYGEGQKFEWAVSGVGISDQAWKSISVENNTTEVELTIPSSSYYPYTNAHLEKVWMRVKGRRENFDKTVREEGKRESTTVYYKTKDSDWAVYTYDMDWPADPDISAALSAANQTRFSWKIENDPNSSKWYTRYHYQTTLVKNSTVSDGSKISFSGSYLSEGYGTDPEGYKYIEMDTSGATEIVNNTWTRWMRIRAQGPRGNSYWRYAKHVYAKPNAASITDSRLTKIRSNAYLIWLLWTLDVTENRPVDSVTVQYVIETPGNSLVAPSNGWSDAPGGNIIDTSGTDGFSFEISETIGLDECLWVRVVSQHDEVYSYSEPRLVGKGRLALPTGFSVTANDSTHKVNISCTNNSDVPDSFIAIQYIEKKKYPSGIYLALIPHNQSSVSNVQCPNWGDGTPYFVAWAGQGTYTAKALGSDSTVTQYNITWNMWSEQVTEGGQIPSAPKNVTVESSRIENTITVGWDWSWSGATCAELSWSDREDAWNSTTGPSTYVVERIEASSWNIADISPGVKNYVRVRLGVSTGDNDVVYGPYSITQEVVYSSPPLKPVLSFSKSKAAETDTITAFWNYYSTDGTQQSAAEIEIAVPDANVQSGTQYISFLHETTASYSVFTASQIENTVNLFYGPTSDNPTFSTEDITTYQLRVKVTAESGGVSEWSDLTPITVAKPFTCELANSSMEYEIIPVDSGVHTKLYHVCDRLQRTIALNNNVPVVLEPFVTYTTNEIASLESGTTINWTSYRLHIATVKNSILFDTSGIVISSSGEISVSSYAYVDILTNPTDINTIGTSGSLECDVEIPFTIRGIDPPNNTGTLYLEININYDGDVGECEVILSGGFETEYELPDNRITIQPLYQFTCEVPTTVYKTKRYITSLPFTALFYGAGASRITSLSLTRKDEYHLNRPDETEFVGNAGETIFTASQIGESEFTINRGDLLSPLEDGGTYLLTGSISDDIGQKRIFSTNVEVNWLYKAVVIPEENISREIVTRDDVKAMALSVTKPTGAQNDDLYDIYRLSTDKPELVYENAEYGQTYIDPYPTMGDYGGYRFVSKTASGNYVTSNDTLAWTDISDHILGINQIIDFGRDNVSLLYNVDLSSAWKKDFKQTKYLGGSIQGDWNPGVIRTGNVNGVVVTATDQQTIEAMRRLAVYPGICRVRTVDGSNYAADVQVSESRGHGPTDLVTSFTLSVTRVDQVEPAGMTEEAWIEELEEE